MFRFNMTDHEVMSHWVDSIPKADRPRVFAELQFNKTRLYVERVGGKPIIRTVAPGMPGYGDAPFEVKPL